MTSARYPLSSARRRCRECERVFRPSSRHVRCPSCRARDVCKCGRSKQVKSVTCRDCRSVRRRRTVNWKGGRTRHKAGYVIGCARSSSCHEWPICLRAILVAERLLGRYLHDGETVDHRNGVWDDNRPRHENLELWTSPKPSGISDAIEWAHAILEQYVSESDTSNGPHDLT